MSHLHSIRLTPPIVPYIASNFSYFFSRSLKKLFSQIRSLYITLGSYKKGAWVFSI